MTKRLSLLCAAVLALAACSSAEPPAPTAPTAPAATAATVTTPAAPATPATASQPASPATTAAPAASSSTPAPAPAPTEPAKTVAAAPFVDTGKWVEGKNYFLIDPAQPTSHPDKIEVTEVFSYGCPACNQFHPFADKIAKSLPSGAVMNYLAASFRPDENWPVYQRAFYAAQALGVAEKAHDAMFDAVWKGDAPLATYNLKGNGLKPRDAWPTIEDIANFYAKYGIDPKEFVAVANSFSVNTQMKRADELMKAYGVDSTPTMIVNGKYRFTAVSAGGYGQTVELAQWLVSKEAAGK